MAYKADLIVEYTQYTYNGSIVRGNNINGDVTVTTERIIQTTYKGKNMSSVLDTISEYRRSLEFKHDISVALSEFGIDSNDKESYRLRIWVERTPK